MATHAGQHDGWEQGQFVCPAFEECTGLSLLAWCCILALLPVKQQNVSMISHQHCHLVWMSLQGVTFPCINHAKSDENDADAANASSRASKIATPKLASFAFRKKDVHKLDELLQVIKRETSGEAASADASSAV